MSMGITAKRPNPVKVPWTHTVSHKCKCVDACYSVVNQQLLHIQELGWSQAHNVQNHTKVHHTLSHNIDTLTHNVTCIIQRLQLFKNIIICGLQAVLMSNSKLCYELCLQRKFICTTATHYTTESESVPACNQEPL